MVWCLQVRSSHRKCSMKGVLKNFIKFTGKHLCRSLCFNKVAGLRPATLLKKRLWHRCFLVNFLKILRKPFQQNTSGGCFWQLIKDSSQTIAHQWNFRKLITKAFSFLKNDPEILNVFLLWIFHPKIAMIKDSNLRKFQAKWYGKENPSFISFFFRFGEMSQKFVKNSVLSMSFTTK